MDCLAGQRQGKGGKQFTVYWSFQTHGTCLYHCNYAPQSHIAKSWSDYLTMQITRETPKPILNVVVLIKMFQIPTREQFRCIRECQSWSTVAGGTEEHRCGLWGLCRLLRQNTPAGTAMCPFIGRKHTPSTWICSLLGRLSVTTLEIMGSTA